jgi:hypothetical protein
MSPASHPADWAPMVSPRVARNEAHFGGRRAERLSDLGIGLGRRFMPLGGIVDTESAIEELNYAAMGQLTARDSCGVVGESE